MGRRTRFSSKHRGLRSKVQGLWFCANGGIKMRGRTLLHSGKIKACSVFHFASSPLREIKIGKAFRLS